MTDILLDRMLKKAKGDATKRITHTITQREEFTYGFAISDISNRGSKPFPIPSSTEIQGGEEELAHCCNENLEIIHHLRKVMYLRMHVLQK